MTTPAAPPQRLTQLPGYDTAPDVYETGGRTSSSLSNTSSHSADGGANTSDTSDPEDEEEDVSTSGYGVSRRRLHPGQARRRFVGASRGVETRGVDYGDRVDGKRRGLTKRSRRVDVDSEEEEEGLEARIARLRREVEECRVEAEKERGEEGEGGGDGMGYLEELGRMIGELDGGAKTRGATGGHKRTGSKYHDAPTIPPTATASTQPSTSTPERSEPVDEQTLTSITTFDTRLTALESALGLSSLDPTSQISVLTAPLLPTLTLLDQQLATLSSATSLSALEAASSRIHKLKSEAASLSQLQSQRGPPTANNNSASTPSASTPTTDDEEEESTTADSAKPATSALLSADDLKTLTELHGLLPTLTSLTPLIPHLTTRLRSLRTLHTTAATAASDLDGIEKRQAEMESELRVWREGLEKVEEAVRESGEANGRNGKVVEGWVGELRERVEKLGR
ncbi:uncharacterized protein MYCGRDRAFT_92852 [Zymoseptoria tritici IPO323]|uniref:Uncharacterized protein n=1 Tax=Zymoseptoria tritici (strain CBS 115943 / IPO323) TaxID=336722 RepID=F9X8N1_ZYMTI|nr:uncharacterized protein MYCGRDRAFT_92852 [Zymoseptoria tritici IPO323]EGP88213.1 hypothetical protein MYCGRDRAFT_92852 [Zymoseptoria tritici IPO323]